MRPSGFGIAVVLLVFAYLALIAWWPGSPAPPVLRPAAPAADIIESKKELCRLARAEREFYSATGHYAGNSALPANGDVTSPPRVRIPYLYSIHVPIPDRFVIVATA